MQARDPIPQLKKYLIDNKLATEDQIDSWEKEVSDVIFVYPIMV